MAKKSIDERVTNFKAARDAKVEQHLSQYAPIWLVLDNPIIEKDALIFEVVFYHPAYQWVKRRYMYDAFTDVLYQRGQVEVDEAIMIDLQSKAPYLESAANNSMLSYGG